MKTLGKCFRQKLLSGTEQVVIITERWYDDKMKDYTYCGYAVKNGKPHYCMILVKDWNRMVKEGRIVEMKLY